MISSGDSEGRTSAQNKVDRPILGGITTFLTMSYIIAVNPSILSQAGIPFSGALTATVLICFLMSLLMGLYAKLPYAVAPGMGLNAFFAYGICIGMGVPWQEALGIVFWAGVFFLLISVTPLRQKIAEAIPVPLRSATSVGIGLFLTLIGLKNMGLVVADPVTLVRVGAIEPRIVVSLLGLALMLLLLSKKSPFAFLVGIISISVTYWIFGWTELPNQWVSMPDFESAFLKLDFSSILKLSLIPALITIAMTDLLDSISTFVGVSKSAGLVDKNGEPKNLREGLIVDAWATVTAGLFGTSSGTAYIESATGIAAGGRSGKTAVVTAICFLPCFFLAPFAAAIPMQATAPVLILVGALMFRNFTELKADRLDDLIPAFLTIILIPFTFSITQGIIWGFISYTSIRLVSGRWREVPTMLYALTALCVALLYFLSQSSAVA